MYMMIKCCLILQSETESQHKEAPVTMGIIRVPKGVLLDCGAKKKEVVSLNIVLQKCTK